MFARIQEVDSVAKQTYPLAVQAEDKRYTEYHVN